MKIAYLLDEDVLLKGFVKREGFFKYFYPDTKKCGF